MYLCLRRKFNAEVEGLVHYGLLGVIIWIFSVVEEFTMSWLS